MTNKERMYAMLDDVVKHFSKNPEELRSVNTEGDCLYHPPTNKPRSIGCAIGMYMSWKNAKELDKKGVFGIFTVCVDRFKAKLLPKWMNELNVEFLGALQRLHDSQENWESKGLSRIGKQQVKRIKIKIKTEKYE